MVLLVVDTQELLVNEKLYQYERFVHNIQKLIKIARENNIEVIYVIHDDGPECELTQGKEGFDIYEGFYPQKNEKTFVKNVNSPFKASGLLNYLKQKEEKEIIVVGLQTDKCINATVVCGFEHDFTVYVPEYANSTIDNPYMSAEQSYHYYNEYMWKGRYARCISMDEIIKKMTTHIIKTDRLLLHPYSENDQEDMIELLTNEIIKETYMIPEFASHEEKIAMFKKLLNYSDSEEHYERGIYLDEKLIGFMNDVEIENGSIELGYVIHPDYNNHGYATEALQAAINDLFQRGYHEVITGAFIENTASIRVMEKCGMSRMDREEDIVYHNMSKHCIYYRQKNCL